MSWTTPFHEGELQAQRLAGKVAQGESNAAIVSEKIMSGALNFIRAQKMAIVSSRNARGQRWASILFGEAGFLEPADRTALTIAIDPKEIEAANPLWENLKADERIGILIIEFQSRTRLRIRKAKIEIRNIFARICRGSRSLRLIWHIFWCLFRSYDSASSRNGTTV